jgi:hypothetical protein
MEIGDILREVVGSALSSIFDPNPIAFRPPDEAGVRPVRAACRKPTGDCHKFGRPLNRNAFLCGCLDFTEREPIEHLIVGLGHKRASTSKIGSLIHAIGTEDSVSIPQFLGEAIREHLVTGFKAEVLIFHNHPPNLLNAIFDNSPLPSAPDRRVLVSHLVQPLTAVKALLGGGRVRCYLAENGFVREFRTPELLSLLEKIATSTRGRNC